MSFRECGEILEEFSHKTVLRNNKLEHFGLTPAHVDGSRSNDNVREVFGICADVDIGPADLRYRTFDAMVAWLYAEGLEFIAFTTTKSREHHHRYRIVLPYECPIAPQRHLVAWLAVNDKLGGVIDAGTKDPARLSFFPARWEGDYECPRTRTLTIFDDGFSAFEMSRGAPILSASELQDLPVDPAPSPRTRAVARKPVSIMPVTSVIKPRIEVEHSFHAVLGDWDRSPFLTDHIRAIADTEGQRDYRFLCAVAVRAISRGMTIAEDLLVELGEVFSYRALFRPPPPDLRRQARNALHFAALNAANPCHPVDGLSQTDAGNLNPS